MTVENPSTLPGECFRCGYDLRGIADEQACPECGLLAGRSRRVSDELRETRPKWLASISLGANLILASIPMAAVWPFLHDLGISSSQLQFLRWIHFFSQWYYSSLLGGFALIAALTFWGVVLLTRREGYGPADRIDRPRRIALRIAAIAPLLSLALFYFEFTFVNPIGYSDSSALYWIAMILLTAGSIPMILLGFLHLRAIAKRARSAHLAEHCAIVGIGTSATALYALVEIIFLTFNRHSWWHTIFSTAGLLFFLVFLCLFGLWSSYLLIGFAVSFRRAAKQIRSDWSRNDRSIKSA